MMEECLYQLVVEPTHLNNMNMLVKLDQIGSYLQGSGWKQLFETTT